MLKIQKLSIAALIVSAVISGKVLQKIEHSMKASYAVGTFHGRSNERILCKIHTKKSSNMIMRVF